MMFPDIVKIILLYVEPIRLCKFFNKHHMNFDFAFRYDARPYELSIDVLNCVFGNFPNVVLIGANIVKLITVDVKKIEVLMKSVRKLRISGRKTDRWEYDDNHDGNEYLDSLKGFPDCPNLEELEICNAYRASYIYMCDTPKLKKVTLRRWYCLDMHNFLMNRNVSTIVLAKFLVSIGDINDLAKVETLKTLIFNQCEDDWYCYSDEEVDILRMFFSLRRLKKYGCMGVFERVMIKKCPNLHHIVISDWSVSVKLEVLYNCTKLKTIHISGTGMGENTLDLSKFRYLRSFIFNGEELVVK